MKKNKLLIAFLIAISIGLVLYFMGVLELKRVKHYGELGIDKIGFSQNAKDDLPKDLQEIYQKIDESVYSLNSNVDFHDISKNDIKKVLEYYKADNPQVFWLKSDFSLEQELFTNQYVGANLEFYYTSDNQHIPYDNDLVVKMNKELEEESKKILKQIPFLSNDYDKAKFIHDYIINTVEYDENADHSHTVYGALVEKKAVCDGLSKAYMYLLSQLNIESHIVYGEAEKIAHAWNIIKLDNEYYHVDITWDMAQGKSDTILYSNFCITDDEAKKTKKIFSPYKKTENNIYAIIPECNGVKNNYFVKEKLLFSEYNDIVLDDILNKIEKANKEKKESLQIKFENNEDFNTFVFELTNGTNQKFYRFPYSNDNIKTTIKTLKEYNICIFEFSYK